MPKSMLKYVPSLLLCAIITTSSSQVEAAPILPDAQGNYYSNFTNVFGATLPDRNKDSPGSLWQVIAPKLHCRDIPSTTGKSLRVFSQGTVLQADVGRGGSDEVNINALDEHQKPWMFVRSRDGEPYRCYVRANQKFIAPLL
ncbi:MAG: hypothetical protein WCO45_00240 [Pseudanabaena sp. ELA607]